ncbi:NAD(P)/FAD-dependent oxidoreductase [Neiella marina]|uniref:NAD(P)/FAD-dependent oxidoreductase n=1 Tax=Neiella holothuriorum TaxID=2870530 RepID=A0ABS7EF43_9GAMM|nr:NAD(P)/FAD-dependent oxidoreductase [Neiella holothuriorum]MBW8190959.1 NAD(P)/FAD-dependent oxidoreductase [Neiella holothuriorum]
MTNQSHSKVYDAIVIGAGAAGLMCAAEAGKRGLNVLLLDHAKQVGKKILISGGGRCNFTNYYVEANAYLSQNPHFCKSALSRYTQWDFIALVDKHGIAYHEKTLGQLFCDDSAKDIVNMLVDECNQAGVTIQLRTAVTSVDYVDNQYQIATSDGLFQANRLVVATGGLSMPKLGATAFGFELARQFGLNLLETRAGLVPFTLQPDDKRCFEPISGVSAPSVIESESGTSFKENLLFTHRGISGPAVLQISSFWQSGEPVYINLIPSQSDENWLLDARKQQGERTLKTLLSEHLAKRIVEQWLLHQQIENKPLKQFDDKQLVELAQRLARWPIKPSGTEGYRTAEVTLGGVDTNELSSKTMEAKKQPGLYFIGEVVDVTGWLGGYNFQWAWSSGWACAQAL